jgi:hypothetical protein
MVGVHTVGDAAADATGEGSTQVVHHVVLGLLGRGDGDGLVSSHGLGDDARGEQRIHLLALHLRLAICATGRAIPATRLAVFWFSFESRIRFGFAV